MLREIELGVTEDIEIVRYTTPEVAVGLEVAPSQIEAFKLYLKQNAVLIEVSARTTVEGMNKVVVKLTGEQTGQLVATTKCQLQARYSDFGGNRYATDIYEGKVIDVLKDELV